MSVRILQRAQARLDFWRIVDSLAAQNVSAAERFIKAVRESYEFLADWPEIGGRIDKDDPEFADIRLWSVNGFRNYLILYRAGADRIEILHLTHASRDLESLLSEQ
jgi:plasmid stabilization system protein ParE